MLEHPEGIPLSPDGLPQAVATLKEDAHDIPAAAREVDPKRLEEIEDRIAAYFGDSSIDDAFNVIDGDGNQYLDYMEFKRLILDKARMQLTDAEFVRLMNVYDENQDGVISLTEFKLKYVGPGHGRSVTCDFIDVLLLLQHCAFVFTSYGACGFVGCQVSHQPERVFAIRGVKGR